MTWTRKIRAGMRWLPLLTVLLVFTVHAADKKDVAPDIPPAMRIPVGPLGYVAPSSFYLTARLSSISLDFLDKNHLLFTFRIPGLMKRLPDSQPDDDDQMIRALVLELPKGNVVAQAEWRMHDRARYLWRLGNGQFLVRQRNSLFVTDKSLELSPFLEVGRPLKSVQFSGDHTWMALEVEGGRKSADVASTAPPSLGDVLAEKPVQIYVVRTATRQVIARAETLNPVDMPMIGDGHVQSVSGQKESWLIRYNPFKGEARTLAETESRCRPAIVSVSKDVVLALSCVESSKDHQVTAVSLDGRKLWQQRWEGRYVWPTFQLAEDGSRFAFSSLEVSHPMGVMDPIDESTIQHQMVGVFDTETGKLRLVKDASPILSAGQNYALSPDGLRFAVLRNGAIEVFDLPLVAAP